MEQVFDELKLTVPGAQQPSGTSDSVIPSDQARTERRSNERQWQLQRTILEEMEHISALLRTLCLEVEQHFTNLLRQQKEDPTGLHFNKEDCLLLLTIGRVVSYIKKVTHCQSLVLIVNPPVSVRQAFGIVSHFCLQQLNEPSVPLAPLQLDFSHLSDETQRFTLQFGGNSMSSSQSPGNSNEIQPNRPSNNSEIARKIETQLVNLLRVLMDNVQYVQQKLLLLADKVPVETSQEFRISLVSVLRNIRYCFMSLVFSIGPVYFRWCCTFLVIFILFPLQKCSVEHSRQKTQVFHQRQQIISVCKASLQLHSCHGHPQYFGQHWRTCQ